MSGNMICIGGTVVVMESGKITAADPTAVYARLDDDNVNEYWDFVEKNEAIQKAMIECKIIVARELKNWGRARGEAKKQKRNPK